MILFLPFMILAVLCLTLWREQPVLIRGVLILMTLASGCVFLLAAANPILNYLFQGKPALFASDINDARILSPVPLTALVRGIILCCFALFFPVVTALSSFPSISKKMDLKKGGSLCALICALAWGLFAIFLANTPGFTLFHWGFFIIPILTVSIFYLFLAVWIRKGKFETI